MSQGPRAGLLATLVVAGLVASIGLQVARERWYPQVGSPVDELYFTSGDAVGRLALSYKSLLADVYWIRAIQYFAATRLQHRPIIGDDLLYPLLDVTTTLDPAFNIAYRFGAIFLAENRRSSLGRPELAVKLLDKGTAQNPHKWQYLYDKAFVYYWYFGDPKTAAHWFGEAARVPDSPEWMPGLAAYMLAQGGDRSSSRFLFSQIYETAEHEYMRDMAAFRLRQLDALDLIDQLNMLLERYERETGEPALTWEPLVRRGMLRGVPTDPSGTPFVIDPLTSRATVSTDSEYYPLPTEPPTARPGVTGSAAPPAREPLK
ncbi:MAG TPA: hypothetical protein VF198_16040 [Vicinamibacterales bacterium]